MDKKEQEKLITEIIDADAKDGLYDHIGDTNKMVTMKLYTEEQVRKAALFSLAEDATMEKILDLLTPIELPSDEEIEAEASDFGKKYRATTYEKSAYVIGAKWMKDKILNK